MQDDASTKLGRLFRELQLPEHEAAASLSRFQGKLWSTIVVEFSALASDDPAKIVDAVSSFVRAARGAALMLPGEFPEESLCSAFVEKYRATVIYEGHAAVLANPEWTSGMADGVTLGLEQMGAIEHLSVFKRFAPLTKATASKSVLKTLDQNFSRAEGRKTLLQLNADWLKSLSMLQTLPDNALMSVGLRLRQANPLFSKRADELARPLWSAAWSLAWELCEKAGLILLEFTSAHTPPSHVGKYALGVKTTEGFGLIIFREHREMFWRAYDAVLHLNRERATASSSIKLKGDVFDAATSGLSKRNWFVSA